jgi:hypothetical protein
MQKHRSENHCGVVCYIGIEPMGRGEHPWRAQNMQIPMLRIDLRFRLRPAVSF